MLMNTNSANDHAFVCARADVCMFSNTTGCSLLKKINKDNLLLIVFTPVYSKEIDFSMTKLNLKKN